jgi:DNA-directed RNA polymerase specialized sigma24 family protein
MNAGFIGREPTGHELVGAMITLRELDERLSHSASLVLFAKLYWLFKARRSFISSASEDVVVEAWVKAVTALPTFRGTNAGEAIKWLARVARNVSIDEQRKRARERRRTVVLSLVPEPSTSPSLDLLPEADEAEGVAFLIELRDEHLRAFCEERFPRRRAAREQVELAYIAAMDRDEYERILREAEDELERQRIHKKMGRGRDELWLPFLATLEQQATLDDVQRLLVRGLIEALEATRRADHGRTRGTGGGKP